MLDMRNGSNTNSSLFFVTLIVTYGCMWRPEDGIWGLALPVSTIYIEAKSLTKPVASHFS